MWTFWRCTERVNDRLWGNHPFNNSNISSNNDITEVNVQNVHDARCEEESLDCRQLCLVPALRDEWELEKEKTCCSQHYQSRDGQLSFSLFLHVDISVVSRLLRIIIEIYVVVLHSISLTSTKCGIFRRSFRNTQPYFNKHNVFTAPEWKKKTHPNRDISIILIAIKCCNYIITKARLFSAFVGKSIWDRIS